MLETGSPPHTRLSARLLRDIHNRIVKLNDMTWHTIFHTYADPGNVTEDPFVTWLTRTVDWVSFRPQANRQKQLDSLFPCSFSVTSSVNWALFWSLTILPEARSLCFHFMYGKLHCQSTIARFNPDVNATCKFCNEPTETISHLLVECPRKWAIWQEVLSRLAPHLDFQSTDILALLRSMTRFDYIENIKLLRLSYYILLFIWRAHWRYIFDDVPLVPERIIATAFKNLEIYCPQ